MIMDSQNRAIWEKEVKRSGCRGTGTWEDQEGWRIYVGREEREYIAKGALKEEKQ